MTDPITDMLNRIRNASLLLKEDVLVPFSKIKYEIAVILAKEGFAGEVKKIIKPQRQPVKSASAKTGKEKNKAIKITLKYENNAQVISGLKRVSKPGQRIYGKSPEIKRVKGGYGLSIISTSKGLMTSKEAKKNKIGGEILLEVW
ncbi:MAG: 30S ribosomal protein S8 [Candidatus Staskawiczbacteria bacterium]|nr:30S ribosomal protein S8 [Candidatus Staskawiczbacteria bacterium]